jgi:DNA (cytosine-5)-methyltransferase 1
MSDKYIPNYRWNLTDLDKVEKNNLKVFSTFACGGGSTMGYKLAGFDVIGANDIDPEMAWHYKENHKPKYYYLEDIRKFRQRDDLPKELYELDILDGSPPCSSFSMAGSREKDWGKKKVFREGQSSQTLDDLFFDFIELARKLQPKVVIAENVKGLIQGNAKGYVKKIINLFNVSGYDVQLFLLNAATMGVPQKRERVFFICPRKDLNKPKLKIGFNQKPIPLINALDGLDKTGRALPPSLLAEWRRIKSNKPRRYFSCSIADRNEPCQTLTSKVTSGEGSVMHFESPRKFSESEIKAIGSYPQDYIFKSDAGYLIGMSVPPLMTYGLANQIYQQWFKND